jgi:hypothetical protein
LQQCREETTAGWSVLRLEVGSGETHSHEHAEERSVQQLANTEALDVEGEGFRKPQITPRRSMGAKAKVIMPGRHR